MPLPFRAPIISYEKINEIAEEFLKKYGIGSKLPIPIDEVIEFEYGIDILPFPNLQRDFDIEGFISGDLFWCPKGVAILFFLALLRRPALRVPPWRNRNDHLFSALVLNPGNPR